MALDGEMWKDIVALHVTATWLDPTLKSFIFVSNSEERQALLHQAETVVEGHAIATASDQRYRGKQRYSFPILSRACCPNNISYFSIKCRIREAL